MQSIECCKLCKSNSLNKKKQVSTILKYWSFAETNQNLHPPVRKIKRGVTRMTNPVIQVGFIKRGLEKILNFRPNFSRIFDLFFSLEHKFLQNFPFALNVLCPNLRALSAFWNLFPIRHSQQTNRGCEIEGSACFPTTFEPRVRSLLVVGEASTPRLHHFSCACPYVPSLGSNFQKFRNNHPPANCKASGTMN